MTSGKENLIVWSEVRVLILVKSQENCNSPKYAR